MPYVHKYKHMIDYYYRGAFIHKTLNIFSHIRVLLVIHGFQVSVSGPLEGFLTQLKQN